MTLDEAIEVALNGEGVLFVGAGFARKAEGIEQRELQSGPALAARLFADCGQSGYQGDLDLAAAHYLKKKGADALVELLKGEFTVTSILDAHKIFGCIPWRRVYTTNYDEIVERAYLNARRPYHQATLTSDVRDHAGKANVVVHINGVISRLSLATLNHEFKLTSASYLTKHFQESPWSIQFRYDLRLAKAVFFVGYSLYDLDIARVLFEEQVHEKTFFVVSPDTDPNDPRAAIYEQFGAIAPIGMETFADLLKARRQSFVPAKLEPLLTDFEQVIFDEVVADRVADSQVIDLLVQGKIIRPMLWRSVTERSSGEWYYLCRSELDRLVEITKRHRSNVLLTGSLGNGKSLLLEGLFAAMHSDGYRCYSLTRPTERWNSELDQILSHSGKCVIAVENYTAHKEILKFLFARRGDNTAIVLTSRTEMHELLEDVLNEAAPGETISEVNTDILRDEDGRRLVARVDQLGLWGEFASFSLERKLRFFQTDCGGELSQLLLHVLNSPEIRSRYQELFEAIGRDNIQRKFLIATFVLQVLQTQPRLDTLRELLAARDMRLSDLKANPAVRQVVDFGRNEVVARSSVLAQFFLRNMQSSAHVVDVLVEMAVQADRHRDIDAHMVQIARSLMLFSNLQKILPESQKRPAIINFYEHTKNLSYAVRNPQFWLQYGIARLTFGSLDLAETLFETAYGYAKRLEGYDTFRLDNHFARLRLEQAAVATTKLDGLERFIEARNIIEQQVRREHLHYPYRVATIYGRVFDRWASELSSSERDLFAASCKSVLGRLEALHEPLRSNSYVLDCEREARRVLAIVRS